ncbi:hypothetical protein Nepgr_026697 [Nepenthes gracilis]|uniref:Uncharacterized protein n=1 Tax=Nepenthes gracilis TaxID=150966 RepID=A0AAD3Y2C1_NEPGR|nr:hypothetical protein Nepgr_026697 [Nepenthes gracilis]
MCGSLCFLARSGVFGQYGFWLVWCVCPEWHSFARYGVISRYASRKSGRLYSFTLFSVFGRFGVYTWYGFWPEWPFCPEWRCYPVWYAVLTGLDFYRQLKKNTPRKQSFRSLGLPVIVNLGGMILNAEKTGFTKLKVWQQPERALGRSLWNTRLIMEDCGAFGHGYL